MMSPRVGFKKLIPYLYAVIASIVLIYPLLFTLISSFKSNYEIYGSVFSIPKTWRLDNYITAMDKANIGMCILNSVFYAVTSTILVLFLSSMVSFVLARYNFRLRNSLYIYFTIGFMVPIYSLIVPISRLSSLVGARNSYAFLIILYAAFEIPFSVFLITGFMKGITKEIDESAIIDGAGPFTLLTRIIMPLAMPAISTAGILAFLNVYNELIWAVVLINKKQMFNISIGLISFVGERGYSEQGPTFAAIMLSIAPTIIIYLFFQEKVEKGLTAGAVKS